MPKAWTCTADETHVFLQAGIEEIAKLAPHLQRGIPALVCDCSNRRDGDPDAVQRFFCPICSASGLSADVRPATDEETNALLARQPAVEAA